MTFSTKELDGFDIAALDGDIGHLREIYFDDTHWTIRHLIADTGGWLAGRCVLLSPHAVIRLDRARHRVELNLRRDQVQKAPGIDDVRPVSRQQESAVYDHYGHPYWWGGAGLWGAMAFPGPVAGAVLADPPVDAVPGEAQAREAAERERADPHLRSSAEVIGYHIEAQDGSIGHIDDLLFDERSWTIHHAVVDTRNWLPGRLVLIETARIAGIDWDARQARVEATRKAIEASPPYDRNAMIDPAAQAQVLRHFERSQ
jgi:uncharacterized protein YrrD